MNPVSGCHPGGERGRLPLRARRRNHPKTARNKLSLEVGHRHRCIYSGLTASKKRQNSENQTLPVRGGGGILRQTIRALSAHSVAQAQVALAPKPTCKNYIIKVPVLPLFELCRRTQQPSLTFRLVGGSTFGLWSLFHLRDGGKWTEISATQHGGTLRH
jgi:hypothetical protein